MPPQSRGASPEPGQHSPPKSPPFPPTLRPYLENLPAPTLLLPDQRTPTGPRMMIPDRDMTTPTPTTPQPQQTRPRAVTPAFVLAGEEPDRTEEEGSTSPKESTPLDEVDVAGVTLDDDDFESHYSRQESEESEWDEEGEGSEEEVEVGDEQDPQNNAGPSRFNPSSPARPDMLSRVRSLPTRPPLSGAHANAHNQAVHELHTSQSTTSLPPPPPPPLYPPFYNRPPTPLPPSPSLTSLLRPPSLLNRSTASTRPTTPDSSDVETPNDTEAAVAHSARRAHPLPPTSPKVPTYEYYGFVLYLASSLAFLFYILWSYLPSPFLHALGITYYPNRWWSLAIPAWIVILLVYIYVALLSYNVEYLTLPLDSLECMVDEAANVAILDELGRVRKGGSKRLIKQLDERERMEIATSASNARGGKALLKYPRGGTGNSSKIKEKTRRRSSHARPGPVRSQPPDLPARDFQRPQTDMTTHSSRHRSSGYPPGGASFPYLSGTDGHSRDSPAGATSHSQHVAYPNWKLVWNEGTDAVMDIPIGGVCEVLYG
ncbi:hypothetical protein A1O3_00146 [Capronia epimyces CBS 606.96]|uniref:PIG-P domain-containing protein n=1 Tax=Capronia epimyces CBS 606.96 TaxID=1182542 RepID=W9YGC7_9EURO|nr:uncharacterized protein A1O3_00146 [Capronia epimyces CBS 606.96]EXJ91598.1 hypothetical protein A1O3_00146 [Capronia epimyces CBS 606.96]